MLNKTSQNILQHTIKYLSLPKVNAIQNSLKHIKTLYSQHRMPIKNFRESLNVALILSRIEMGTKTIQSCLIYYATRRTHIKPVQITQYDSDTSIILQGLDEVDQMKRYYHTSAKKIKHSRNFRRLLLAVCPDIRVMIIEVARQLDICRHLPERHLTKQGKRKRALKTFYIYAPIAGRLGIETLKWRLQDSAFKQLKPQPYHKIMLFLKKNQIPRMHYIKKLVRRIKKIIQPLGIDHPLIYGRPKHIYSIYHKIITKHKNFGQIYDFLAVRVITNTIKECYAVLGLLQSDWKPINNRFKDYVAKPKQNLYQSIHTTVIGPEHRQVEIQIRTKRMHQIDEYGVAAHWAYKRGIKNKVHINSTNHELNLFKQMIAMRKNSHNPYNLKSNLFNNHVYVFTPGHDVLELPAHSGPLDMAYRIHTEVGNHAIGAKVNGKIVSWDYQLNDGDRVSIITSTKSSGPSRDWLRLVASSQARRKIRRFLRRQNRQYNVSKGRQELAQEINNEHFESFATIDFMKKFAQKKHYPSYNTFLESIGLGNTSIKSISDNLTRYAKRQDEKNNREQNSNTNSLQYKAHNSSDSASEDNNNQGVIIARSNNFLFRISHCCFPVPGDKVVGYITQNKGISIHRIDCPKIKKMPHHLVRARWVDDKGNGNYLSKLKVLTYEHTGMFDNVLHIAQNSSNQVVSIQDKIKHNRNVIILIVKISNLKDLKILMARIRAIRHVYQVTRNFD